MCEMKTSWYARQERSLKDKKKRKKHKRNCLFRAFHIWVVIGTASSLYCRVYVSGFLCVSRVFFGFSSAMRMYIWRITIRIKNAQNWNIHTRLNEGWRTVNARAKFISLRTHDKTATQNLFYVSYVLDDVFGGIFSLLFLFLLRFSLSMDIPSIGFFPSLWVLIRFRGYQWNWYRSVVFPQTTQTRTQTNMHRKRNIYINYIYF